MDQKGYQTSYKIEMLINQTCPSHVHNGWSQILQSTSRIGNKRWTHFFVWSQQRDRGLESKGDQTQLNARKPGFADLYGREALDHMPESLPLFNNAALPLLTGPTCQQAGLISISMSASCWQYVITILPADFLQLTANLELQHLCFVRIQLVQ